MSSKPAQVIMDGPPGQNLDHWFDYLDKRSDIATTFVCSASDTMCKMVRANHPRLRIIKFRGVRRNPFGFAGFLGALSPRRYDLLILQGLYDWKLAFMLLLFVRAKRKYVQIWNASSHQQLAAERQNLSRCVYYWAFQKCDGILFTWESNRQDFIKFFPEFENKTRTFPWGLEGRYFDLSYHPEHPLVDKLLADIASDDILIFWPRSIQPKNRHDILLQSLLIVRERVPDELWARVRVILMGGVRNRAAIAMGENITRMGLSTCVKFHCGELVEKKYLLKLYDRADIYINLADNDQLTYGIIEAAARRTNLILSNIPPYKYLRELGLDVFLVENDPTSVADALCKMIIAIEDGNNPQALDENQAIVKRLFCEEETFGALFQYCLGDV